MYVSQKKDKVDKKSEPKVYFIDEKGKSIKSDKGIDFFLNLSQEGQVISSESSDIITPEVVPIEPGAIKITESMYRSFTNEKVDDVIALSFGTLFGVSWAKFGGQLVKLGVGTIITESAWMNAFLSTAIGIGISKATDWAQAEPTYSEAYQYKTWSDYYNAYMVYQVIIFYEDSGYSNPLEVNYWHVDNEYNDKVGM